MRAALLTGTLLVAFAMPAFAQGPSGQQGQQQRYQGNGQYQNNQGGFGSQGPMWRGNGPRNWHGGPGSWGDMAERFGPGHMRQLMGIVGALSEGTFYRFKRGKDEVDIHCPPREQLQACVNGATELMKTMQQVGSPVASGQSQSSK